jgi:hypothetical protein
MSSGGDRPQPARKQRRVRDPYAIDSDDEDMEELFEAPKSKPQKEESLLDFLKSVPPPPTNDQAPQPFLLTTGAGPGQPPKSSGGMSATSVIKSRLKKTIGGNDHPDSPTTVASGSGRFPIDTKSHYISSSVSNSNNRINTNAVSPGYPPRVSRDQGRNPQPMSHTIPVGTPRSPQRQTETSALADFLRNTGPPEAPPVRPSTSLSDERKESSTLSKLFSRRRKLEA